MVSVLSIVTVVTAIIAFVAYKFWAAKREIEQVLKVNASLEQANQQQAVKIQTQQAEISNAKIQRKHSQAVQHSSAVTVDSQLQQHNWFRDDDHHHGLQRVQPDLSKPCGHGGNETSDTCSQSNAE